MFGRATIVLVSLGVSAGLFGQGMPSEDEDCRALTELRHLTIDSARWVEAKGQTPAYCHARGSISPAIRYHVQLPAPSRWNGRFLNWGDGAKDGDLDFADHRLAEGYVVANSNTGHDAGSDCVAAQRHLRYQ